MHCFIRKKRNLNPQAPHRTGKELLVVLDNGFRERFHFYMQSLKMEQIEQLGRAQVLVIGDLILDHYIHGYTERTSPEAPVPVVVYQGEDHVPGGAANV